jgi:hypothetical protein
LGRELDYDNYREEFEFSLSEILEQYVSEEEAEKLAHQCARHQQSAVDEVNQLLADGSQSIDQSWTARKPTKPNRSQEIIRGTIRAPSRRSMSFSLPMA